MGVRCSTDAVKTKSLPWSSAHHKLFAGHTGSEQYMFFCTCAWFLHPLLLVLCAERLQWNLRDYQPLGPWVAMLNVASSLAHWARYEPRSPQQTVDVLLALMVCVLVLVEVCAVMGVGGEPLVTPAEAGLLSGGMACFVVVGELDAFHSVRAPRVHCALSV